ncbi:AraC family transcriptional regulator [Amycolatopsis vastitatis]|uniref:AraC family transcriptional regulator n=1 Tax=Amycolatopsis vastitatis TaxID=1905142 RepID=A0A229SNX7_9PSEU|nr:AraC family transcriptional regulator [Amycolatopsis vastitatis]OXM60735.1 AraC family transcriptional regulator [Amycolatopsis vastitatis]
MCLSLKAAAQQHFRELALLRRVRDRIDREHALPLDIDSLAAVVDLPIALFVRRFRDAYGLSPHDYRRAAEAVRNREALAADPAVA